MPLGIINNSLHEYSGNEFYPPPPLKNDIFLGCCPLEIMIFVGGIFISPSPPSNKYIILTVLT